jgi:hypothetical protein
VYIEELNDEIELDVTTGKLPISVCKNLQGAIDTAINTQMTSKGEISGITSYVNPAQNVQATSLVEIELNVRKKGTGRQYKVKLAFAAFAG